MAKITDEQIVEAAKAEGQKEDFGELVHSEKSRGVNSAYGIGFIEGAVWTRDQYEQQCHGCFDRDEVFRHGMLKGAKEKEEEMKRTAIEANVSFGQPVLLNELIPTSLAKDGDKVKLIIIKDDGGQV